MATSHPSPTTKSPTIAYLNISPHTLDSINQEFEDTRLEAEAMKEEALKRLRLSAEEYKQEHNEQITAQDLAEICGASRGSILSFVRRHKDLMYSYAMIKTSTGGKRQMVFTEEEADAVLKARYGQCAKS